MLVVSVMHGPLALVGGGLLALALAIVDGLARDRLGLRQVVVLLLLFGLGLVAWGAAVSVLTGFLDLGEDPNVRVVVIAGGACLVAALSIGVLGGIAGRGRNVPPATTDGARKRPPRRRAAP